MTGFERYRRKKLLTRDQLAEYMGVTSAAVGKWESGKSFPTAEKLEKLSNLYGVPMNALMRSDYPENDLALPTESNEDAKGA